MEGNVSAMRKTTLTAEQKNKTEANNEQSSLSKYNAWLKWNRVNKLNTNAVFSMSFKAVVAERLGLKQT